MMELLPAAPLQAAPDLTDSELQQLFSALDVDNTGSVDAQEFFAGVLQAVLLPQQTHTVLEASFNLLDRWGACGVRDVCVCTQTMTTRKAIEVVVPQWWRLCFSRLQTVPDMSFF